MLGKSQIFSLTTESGISGILSGKPLKNNLGNRHIELWGKHPKQKKNWEIEEKLVNAIFSSRLLNRDFRETLNLLELRQTG